MGLDVVGQLLISIHPPHAGRDYREDAQDNGKPIFQSTLPMRGGTLFPSLFVHARIYFNPPSPCGEGHLRQRPFAPGP